MDPSELEEPGDELERLAAEQLSDLNSDSDDRSTNARVRRERVLSLYRQGEITEPFENYHAALIMLYGDEIAHYELARTFARRAAALGEPRAWSVVAAAWDRILLRRNRPQRYGTQFIREEGRWTLGEVDPAVTDAERAFYGIPPLWVQRQNAAALQRREDRNE